MSDQTLIREKGERNIPPPVFTNCPPRTSISPQDTTHRRPPIGRNGHLDQSEAHDPSQPVREHGDQTKFPSIGIIIINVKLIYTHKNKKIYLYIAILTIYSGSNRPRAKAGTRSAQRRRRWANVKTASSQCLDMIE